ncbi:hypothetical protein LINGRAHAP2_LOCUS19240, partial [Linum grandiflorum]
MSNMSQDSNSEAGNASLPPPPLVRQPPNHKEFRSRGVEDFYYETPDPVAVERWLGKVTRTLQEMRASDEDRVLLTLSLLQGAAHHWWLTQAASQQDPPEITWAEFLVAFRNHFIPTEYLKDKQREFLLIKQKWGDEGRETVAEYTARFNMLLQYGGPQFQDPVTQMEHYLHNLRSQIYLSLSSQTWRSREDVYSAALRVERAELALREEKRAKANKEIGKKRPPYPPRGPGQGSQSKRGYSGPPSQAQAHSQTGSARSG